MGCRTAGGHEVGVGAGVCEAEEKCVARSHAKALGRRTRRGARLIYELLSGIGGLRPMISILLATGLWACGAPLDLIGDAGEWSANIDRGGTTVALGPTAEAKLAARIATDGGDEDYPKLRLTWDTPQDWTKYSLLRVRLRVTSSNPQVREKQIAFVFYDENTRLTDYPGNPMRQQVISHVVAVNQWTELRDWLHTINRSAIRQFDVYVYELGPLPPHEYTWEFAEMRLEEVTEQTAVLDGEVYARKELAGRRGRTVGRVTTADGLQLLVGSAGDVGVAIDGRPIEPAGAAPTGLLVRDVAAGTAPVMAGGRVERRGQEILQTARLSKMGLAVEAAYRSRGGYIEVAGSVENLTLDDRAVTVYLAVPVGGGEWIWWDGIAESRQPGEAHELSTLETGMEWGLNGAHSKYPLSALTWPGRAGLSLAIRMDEPVVHRIGYSVSLGLLYVAFDFGLLGYVPVDGKDLPARQLKDRPLAKAPFRVLIYRHDPHWGFRSALDRYYGFFPEFFEKRVAREGGWYVWGNAADTPGAIEAGFAFHWGPAAPEAVKWDNQHGFLALHYIEPELYQQTMGDFERAPTREECLERLHKLVAGDEEEIQKMSRLSYARGGGHLGGAGMDAYLAEHDWTEFIRGISAAAEKSVNYDRHGSPHCGVGKYPWMGESQWGCIFPCNLDPEMPGGKGRFNIDVVLSYSLRGWEAQGARIDGIALDSLGGYGQHARANYRREHFAWANVPLSFSAVQHVPVQVAAFATIEWLRELAADMHGRGKVLMANCSWSFTPGWLTFAAPYLDIFGAEAPKFADPDYIRAIARGKPCTDLPYDPRPEWEVEWHLLHDIYPGHGNNPEVMARYAATLRELSAAGWEPITAAWVEPAAVRIERYGRGQRFYLVLHNPQADAQTAKVTLDLKRLGWRSFSAQTLNGAAIPVGAADFSLELPAQATQVVVVKGS